MQMLHMVTFLDSHMCMSLRAGGRRAHFACALIVCSICRMLLDNRCALFAAWDAACPCPQSFPASNPSAYPQRQEPSPPLSKQYHTSLPLSKQYQPTLREATATLKTLGPANAGSQSEELQRGPDCPMTVPARDPTKLATGSSNGAVSPQWQSAFTAITGKGIPPSPSRGVFMPGSASSSRPAQQARMSSWRRLIDHQRGKRASAQRAAAHGRPGSAGRHALSTAKEPKTASCCRPQPAPSCRQSGDCLRQSDLDSKLPPEGSQRPCPSASHAHTSDMCCWY
jgi:hypothetical protein